MRIRRRNLRRALVGVGCLVGAVGLPGLVAGGVLLAAGSALHFWSKGCLEQNQRLVTAGPYRFSRNPFYLANLLIDLGLCCVIGRIWVAVPYLVVWWLAYRETIVLEEVRLATLFPGLFERYVAAVPRLIPTGRSWPRSEAAGGFTLGNPALAQGSEYARIVGVWVAAATIVAWDWIRGHGLEVFAAQQTAGLGLVALVPVAWVAKLALAEVFRSPETALLPFADEPSRRRLVTFALVVGLYLAARIVDASPHSLPAAIAFGLMLLAIAVLPRAGASVPLRAGLHAGLAIAMTIFGWSRDVLWLASVPLLWVVLAGLDDLAMEHLRVRIQGEPETNVERRPWPAFWRIVAGGILSLLLVAMARNVT